MLTLTESGLYCEAGGFHIDPSRAVKLALITHAHSDHARRGSQRYLCARSSAGLLAERLRLNAQQIQSVPFGEAFHLGDVKVSFHPAGHILGSAQVRLELGSRVWVVSGDYKREADPSCEPFETVTCDTFVTEATFGHPQYQWEETSTAFEQIYRWWQANRARKKNSLLHCYSLGKSQRVLAELRAFTQEPAYVFGETAALTERYRQHGIALLPALRLEEALADGRTLEGALVIAPHSISRTPWIERLGTHETAFASGWMQSGAFGMAARYDRGFVISDHADWPALVRTVAETGARRVLVQHAHGSALVRHLKARGVEAAALNAASLKRAALPLQQDLFAFTD